MIPLDMLKFQPQGFYVPSSSVQVPNVPCFPPLYYHFLLNQLQELQNQKIKSEPENEKPAVDTFSISSLLRDGCDEHMCSNSPTSSSEDVTIYTLDGLETTDGRAKNQKAGSSRCVCEQCGKSYATTSNLSRHKQTHRPLDSPHAKQCPHCDRVYVSMPALSMHILTHKANHECNVCGKVFSRLWLLQGHLRSHTGQRPFGCAHCGKNFADRSNLRAHILTHTGEKRFGCDRCGRRFALRSYLNRHKETACRHDNSTTTAIESEDMQ